MTERSGVQFQFTAFLYTAKKGIAPHFLSIRKGKIMFSHTMNKEYFDSIAFEKKYHCDIPLGSFCSSEGTLFRLWAPMAEKVVLHIRKSHYLETSVEKSTDVSYEITYMLHQRIPKIYFILHVYHASESGFGAYTANDFISGLNMCK